MIKRAKWLDHSDILNAHSFPNNFFKKPVNFNLNILASFSIFFPHAYSFQQLQFSQIFATRYGAGNYLNMLVFQTTRVLITNI